MRLKAISMLLFKVKIVKADVIFSHPITSTTKAKLNMISAEMVWQAIKDALTDLIGLETLMIFILILLFIGLILKIYSTKKTISKCQTKL